MEDRKRKERLAESAMEIAESVGIRPTSRKMAEVVLREWHGRAFTIPRLQQEIVARWGKKIARRYLYIICKEWQIGHSQVDNRRAQYGIGEEVEVDPKPKYWTV